MNTYCIYVHINKINGLKYVGQTSLSPTIRWGKDGYGYRNQRFYKAIQQYGWDGFDHLILEENLNAQQADEREQYWIKFFNSIEPYGYNVSPGGSGVTEATRLKMSISGKENWEKMPPEWRESKRELMRQINKTIDRTGENNGMYKKDRSGINAGNKRKVQCIETKQIFETVTDASKWCNGTSSLKSHIAQQIRGVRKSCGKHPITKEPLHWRYIE